MLANIFFSLSFSLTCYIDIIPRILELAREKFEFLCQEILTKLLLLLCVFGMVRASRLD